MHACVCFVCVFSVCVCLPHVCRCLLRSEEGVGSSGAGVTAVVSHQTWVLRTELRPLEEQQALLNSEPSLQTHTYPLCFFVVFFPLTINSFAQLITTL